MGMTDDPEVRRAALVAKTEAIRSERYALIETLDQQRSAAFEDLQKIVASTLASPARMSSITSSFVRLRFWRSFSRFC
jgi:hypothetical protein